MRVWQGQGQHVRFNPVACGTDLRPQPVCRLLLRPGVCRHGFAHVTCHAPPASWFRLSPGTAQPKQHMISSTRRFIVSQAAKDNNTSSNSSSNSSSSSSGEDPSRRPTPPNSWSPLAWLQRVTASWRPQQPVRLLLNMLMLFLLMRLWPVGGRLGMGESETLVVNVPFSEFIKRVKHDDVQSVAVDGLHISFSLKPTSLGLPGEPADPQTRLGKSSQFPRLPLLMLLPRKPGSKHSWFSLAPKHQCTVLVDTCHRLMCLNGT